MAIVLVITMATVSYALPVSHYATNSVLAEGRWAKIKVNATGMQLISNADLKALGFTDPQRVNIYGTGGQMVEEELTENMPDDLPLLPSVKTSRGILFFGVDNVKWRFENGTYSHELNPYCGDSYYFISDREIIVPEMQEADASSASGGETVTEFRSRLLYETDMSNPSGYGRWLFGEDFRSQNSRRFSFDLIDKTSDDATANVRFAAYTSNGRSNITFTANGQRITTAVINGISNDDFFAVADEIMSFKVADTKLSFGIDYSNTGVLFNANLDYIEVFYNRELKLNGGQLHFYSGFRGETVRIKEVPDGLVVWDVTDPCSPKSVSYSKDGADAVFRAPTGYREYIAFDPSKAGQTVARRGSVANQDIHGMETPDMVIVAYQQYRDAAERIARMHREQDGMLVYVLTPESVYNEFSGGHKDVGAFRKMLKMWHDRKGEREIKYCLLFGRGSYDTKMVTPAVKAAGYEPLPLWQSPTGLNESDAFSTDDIIGMLEDVRKSDFRFDIAKIHVAVGRLPVSSVREAEEISNKICDYALSPDYGTWRNRTLLIADDQDNGEHLRQTEAVYKQLSENAPHYQYERLYLDSYPLESTSVGMAYPKAKERMMRTWNEGVVLTNYIGHASTNSWTHERLLTWEDITSAANKNFSFLVAATCSFGHWDGDTQSGAEVMLLNPTGGFVGALVPSRTVYIGLNGTFTYNLAKWLLTNGEDGKILRFGDAVVRGKNAVSEVNRLRYCLMADPALRIPKPENSVTIESFDGEALDAMTDFPEIKAMSKVKVSGSVNDVEGNLLTDFDGFVQLDLYDAEKAIETYGNGSDGQVEHYNDRTTKLASVSTKVKYGKWETTVFIPSEIENNYSPARITAYAWSDSGKEGQGSFERFYVYGFPEGESEDVEGPVIETLYLNHSGFAEGGVVGENSVLHASVIDESGINLSGAGVGHKMAVVLDRREVFDDVDSYYQPDYEREGAGTVVYPLNGLKAGEHTLTFKVYDNANNASERTLIFNVAATMDPVIRELFTNVNPASESVVFSVLLDSPNSKMTCRLEVFDLMGKRIWVSDESETADMHGMIQKRWDLCDSAGRRVPRGIYIYRATAETAEGRYSSKTNKLAVTAQ